VPAAPAQTIVGIEIAKTQASKNSFLIMFLLEFFGCIKALKSIPVPRNKK
jgi:hypothetical protein